VKEFKDMIKLEEKVKFSSVPWEQDFLKHLKSLGTDIENDLKLIKKIGKKFNQSPRIIGIAYAGGTILIKYATSINSEEKVSPGAKEKFRQEISKQAGKYSNLRLVDPYEKFGTIMGNYDLNA
jgi:hypothetical protein